MEWTFGMSAALISCLYLSIVTTQVSGKCRGYNKQACYGGNGKRSDPNFNLSPPQSASSSDLRDPGILSKVLISDIDRFQGTDSKNSWLGSVQSYLSSRSAYPDSYETGSSLRSTNRADDAETEESSKHFQAKLELALAEMAELRKYISILENMLRASSADLA